MNRNKSAAFSIIIMLLLETALSSDLLYPDMEEKRIDTTNNKERVVIQREKMINDSLVIAYYISNAMVYSDENMQVGGYIGIHIGVKRFLMKFEYGASSEWRLAVTPNQKMKPLTLFLGWKVHSKKWHGYISSGLSFIQYQIRGELLEKYNSCGYGSSGMTFCGYNYRFSTNKGNTFGVSTQYQIQRYYKKITVGFLVHAGWNHFLPNLRMQLMFGVRSNFETLFD